ncbi:transcription antitermination factor NusB [Haloplasma contractile]|uniref:Transcription antitermination protein NusB n=1 Tax=Haloplasma contractile SSD-17B TaxID=1033810 RepID=U2E019_9MOLU|nr:transcription antitermination factor NusB [Haloplasma contractile]ERJ13777.1 N utilization substance protein B [Haloplasma contractile SSD-17B]
MNRKKEREIAILTLYSIELSSNDVNDTVEDVITHLNEKTRPSEHLYETIYGVMEKRTELDKIISRHLEKWNLTRLSFLDQSILRYAVYEMLYVDTVPAVVAIDEAVEFTKRYTDTGDGKAKAFNNSILDKIRKSLNIE